MAREYARVKVSIWADPDFRRLTDAAQALYFRLLTSPSLNACGIADWRPKRIAALTAGATQKSIEKAATELADALFVVIDDETEEVLIRSFVRHDGVLKSPNIAAALVQQYAGTASEILRGVIVYELQRLHAEDPELKGWSKASTILGNPSVNPSEKDSENGLPKGSGKGSPIPQPTTHNLQPSTTLSPPGFDDFWTAWPKKVDKGHAKRAFANALKKVDAQRLVDAAKSYAIVARGTESKFIPHASTWLNGERWEDQEPSASRADRPDPDAWMRRRLDEAPA